jgi:hypothetical protein
LAALTPDPAFAFVAPFGSRTSGQIFRHWAVQGVLLAFNVYTAVPLTKMVPSCGFLEVDMTMLFAL